MGRVSQAEARANRERGVAASRLMRDRGVERVGIADVMGAVGLTPGGFPKQFASKRALAEEAVERAMCDAVRGLEALDGREGTHADAVRAFVGLRLSPGHRDAPGTGCPAAAFAADSARLPELREPYAEGVERITSWIAPGVEGLAALVGAVLLARATTGTELSERVPRATATRLARTAAPDGPTSTSQTDQPA